MKQTKILAKAILEKERYGQLSPKTIEELNKIKGGKDESIQKLSKK